MRLIFPLMLSVFNCFSQEIPKECSKLVKYEYDKFQKYHIFESKKKDFVTFKKEVNSQTNETKIFITINVYDKKLNEYNNSYILFNDGYSFKNTSSILVDDSVIKMGFGYKYSATFETKDLTIIDKLKNNIITDVKIGNIEKSVKNGNEIKDTFICIEQL